MTRVDPRTVRLTTAQATVRYLQSQHTEMDGVRRRLIAGMFGIFGHGNVSGLGQAIQEVGKDLPFYQPRNEQSMVHTAIGYARTTNRLSTLACAASIGPGSTNMVTGAATATINRLPVLLFPADYYATRAQGPVLQQLEHAIEADLSVNDCFRPVSRFFDRITRPEQILTALPEAMRVLTNPVDTGAVTISISQDVLSEAHDYPVIFFDANSWFVPRRAPDSARIEDAVELLRAAERPFIISGGGVRYSDASAELQSFAEEFGIPVGETFAGKGTMPASRLLVGGAGVTGTRAAAALMRDADLVICVGTRLTDFTTGSRSAFQSPSVKFVAINLDDRDAHKMGALPIVGDAKVTLTQISDAARRAEIRPREQYLAEIDSKRAAWQTDLNPVSLPTEPGRLMTQSRLIRLLNDAAEPGDTIIAAAGTPPADLHKLWEDSHDKHCHLEFGTSCMGYEIPASLGVRMASEGGNVVVLIGDGTYLLNPSEIVTAVQEGIAITIIISENHGFQSIHGLQQSTTGRSFATEFRARNESSSQLDGPYLTIDFARNAESMGATAWRAETEEELRKALAEATDIPGVKVLVVQTAPDVAPPGSNVWWDVAPAQASADPDVLERRARYESERDTEQRFYG